jgi:TniQ
MNPPGQQLRRLPIDVRPAAGEHAEIYIRRLARANHLRPSYLRSYLAGPAHRDRRIDPQRLAAITGRPAATLQKTLTARGWPRPPRPPSGRQRRRHADKPALYAQIRAAAQTGTMTKEQMVTHFRVGRQTISKALADPQPPPWKQPFKKQPPPYAAHLDALLAATPDLTAIQLWQQATDHTDIKISYGTVRLYHQQRRQQPTTPPPGSVPPDRLTPASSSHARQPRLDDKPASPHQQPASQPPAAKWNRQDIQSCRR